MKISKEQRVDVVHRVTSGETCASVANHYGVSRACIGKIIKATGISLDNAAPPDTKALAVSLYKQGKDTAEIARIIGHGQSTVYRWVVASGTKTRSLADAKESAKNTNAFATVTPESAYWVGFLMADGCVTHSRAGRQETRISIRLQEADESHLQKFLDFVGSANVISRGVSTGYAKGKSRFASCSVSSRKLAADVGKFGVVPRKTTNAEVKHLESNIDFWRGCIDGDGSVGIYQDRNSMRATVTLCGSPLLMSQFCGFVNASISGASVRPPKMRGIICTVQIAYKYAVELVKLLWPEKCVCLERKRLIVNEIKAMPEISAARLQAWKNVYAPDSMAWCGKCERHYDKKCFHRDSGRLNGLCNVCKQCVSKRDMNRSLRKAEKVKEG